MCERNSQSDSDIETFLPTDSNVDMLCNKYLYSKETYDTEKNTQGEGSINEVPEQDENTSYIDIYGKIEDFTEVLISEVQKRPALYNVKSSIQSRSRVIVNQLWQQIFEVFEGQISIEELKRR